MKKQRSGHSQLVLNTAALTASGKAAGKDPCYTTSEVLDFRVRRLDVMRYAVVYTPRSAPPNEIFFNNSITW